jgi:hypothetical protein
MKTSTHTVLVPVSVLVPEFVRVKGEFAPVKWDSQVPYGTPMECVIYSGLVTITGSCYLVCDEGGQFWECDSVEWILDGAGIEVGTATEPNTKAFPLIIPGFDVDMNPSVHHIVAGSPADVELRRLLTEQEEGHMFSLCQEAAQNDPKYLAFVAERREARQRVADARSALAEAEWILRNPPQEVDEEGDAERRHFSRADESREARFDANREPWGD